MGIGEADPALNPFFAAELPCLEGSLGSIPSLDRPRSSGPLGQAFPLDATLEVDGLPQSGTGQYTLLTGINGAERIGRHFGPWTPTALRPSLARDNVLSRLIGAGESVAFANAHPPSYRQSRWFKRPAPIPLAAHEAGLMTRGLDDLARGSGLASGIDNEGIRRFVGADVPAVTAEEAGRNLARISGDHAFTLFAHYATDAAGHSADPERSKRALERVDALVAGILAARGPDLGVLVASDHGNIESVDAGHTRNPALGVWLPPSGDTDDDDQTPGESSQGHPPLPDSLVGLCAWMMAALAP